MSSISTESTAMRPLFAANLITERAAENPRQRSRLQHVIGRVKAHTDIATLGSLVKYEMGNVRDILDVLPTIHGVVPRMRGRNNLRPLPQFTEMAKKHKKRASRISLASNLRAARSLFRWSQEELGFQCGLKRTYIGALERREVNPGIDNLDKLAVGVGVLAHVLLLSPELAYAEIYVAYSMTSEAAH